MSKNLGDLVDRLYKQKGEVAKAQARLDEEQGKAKAIEDDLAQAMEAAGTERVGGKLANASFSSSNRYSIADWDALVAFIKRKGAFHLFERRLAAKACEEMSDVHLKGKDIPGTSKYTQKRLNLRKV